MGGLAGRFAPYTNFLDTIRGFAEVRVDTHEDNARMRHVIEGCGFAYAGRVFIDGDRAQPRRAYQLFL